MDKFKTYYQVLQVPIFTILIVYAMTNLSFWIILLGIIFGYPLMILSQEVGGHRYFSHHSFEISSLWEKAIALSMMMVGNGSPLDWRVHHLEHHQFSDTDKDPVSPKKVGRIGLLSNMWKLQYKPQHFGLRTLVWVNNKKPQWVVYHKYYFWGMVAYQLICLSLGLQWFIALVCIPVVMTNVYFNCVSAFCHQHRLKYNEPHLALNNKWIDIFSPGTGYHAEHHNKPGIYRYSKLDFAASIIDAIKLNNSQEKQHA